MKNYSFIKFLIFCKIHFLGSFFINFRGKTSTHTSKYVSVISSSKKTSDLKNFQTFSGYTQSEYFVLKWIILTNLILGPVRKMMVIFMKNLLHSIQHLSRYVAYPEYYIIIFYINIEYKYFSSLIFSSYIFQVYQSLYILTFGKYFRDFLYIRGRHVRNPPWFQKMGSGFRPKFFLCRPLLYIIILLKPSLAQHPDDKIFVFESYKNTEKLLEFCGIDNIFDPETDLQRNFNDRLSSEFRNKLMIRAKLCKIAFYCLLVVVISVILTEFV